MPLRAEVRAEDGNQMCCADLPCLCSPKTRTSPAHLSGWSLPSHIWEDRPTEAYLHTSDLNTFLRHTHIFAQWKVDRLLFYHSEHPVRTISSVKSSISKHLRSSSLFDKILCNKKATLSLSRPHENVLKFTQPKLTFFGGGGDFLFFRLSIISWMGVPPNKSNLLVKKFILTAINPLDIIHWEFYLLKFPSFHVFEWSHLCLPKLHLFD